jgi:ketosteroid isomerase-like protein
MPTTAQANTATINRFYNAFALLDAETMATCYADNVQFQDEAFTLNGKAETMAMWNMLVSTTKSKPESKQAWNLVVSGVQADANKGQAHWDASYLFSSTGRKVLNKIDAEFTFNDAGLIATHRDRFNVWTWSRQALGMPGLLLGWTPFFHNKIRTTAMGNLAKYVSQSRK